MTRRVVSKPTSFARRTKLWKSANPSNIWGGGLNAVNSIQGIYRGTNNRFERYKTYEWMDQDSDVSRALDLIAEHCSEKNTEGSRFNISFNTEEITEDMTDILKAHVDYWSKINRMDKSMSQVTRNALKYGDWFLFRNPKTYELYDIHPTDVLGALVEERSQTILGWFVRDFRWNVTDLEIDVPQGNDVSNVMSQLEGSMFHKGGSKDERNARCIPSIHILHFTLSDGKLATTSVDRDTVTDKQLNRWPFGESMLQKSFKTFKYRELLEDSILIHRTQRAPTRNVWYVDTGRMRADRARQVVNNFRDELHMKRIPKPVGGGQMGMDSIYNPLSQLEDIFIPVGPDQRGSKVEQMEGTPWNHIPELKYSHKKLMQSLRVPYAWLESSNDEGGGVVVQNNDVRMGQATQEEVEFSRFCERVHTQLIETWDNEFKMYLKYRDVNINEADFDLKFNAPTDYQASRNRVRLTESINAAMPYFNLQMFSKRFILSKILGFTEDEIIENEQMLDEEMDKEGLSQGDAGFGGGAGGVPVSGVDPLGGAGLDGTLPLAQENPYGGGAIGGGASGLGNTGASPVGAGAVAGGFGESKMEEKDMLLEKESSLSLPKPKRDDADIEGFEGGFDDKSFTGDPVRNEKRFEVSLMALQDLRKVEFAKSIKYKERRKMLSKIYAPIPPDGGLGGGLGGGLI